MPEPSGPTGSVLFLSDDDATELVKALDGEGYAVTLHGQPEVLDAPWRLDVTPFDDDVVAMVDVYGGWLPDER